METIAKRAKRPTLSETGEHVLDQYEQWLRTEEDLTVVTIRNYLSDLRQFAVWCESSWKQGREKEPPFTPAAVTTRTLTDYRTYLQQVLYLKPNSVNRSLISLKRYFTWLLTTGQMRYNPADDVSPHDLRHRFGYRMEARVPLHRLAQLMGHDSLDTTMIYVQATKQDLQQDIERIAWR
jgi:site-specific recombinase XerD